MSFFRSVVILFSLLFKRIRCGLPAKTLHEGLGPRKEEHANNHVADKLGLGLGAGWANVPVLNLLMGAPLKVAVGTSKFLLSITDTSAAWVYLNQGCVIPLMAVPSIVGLMLGSVVGVRLLAKAKPKFIRYMVIGVLFFSGAKALMKGLGW